MTGVKRLQSILFYDVVRWRLTLRLLELLQELECVICLVVTFLVLFYGWRRHLEVLWYWWTIFYCLLVFVKPPTLLTATSARLVPIRTLTWPKSFCHQSLRSLPRSRSLPVSHVMSVSADCFQLKWSDFISNHYILSSHLTHHVTILNHSGISYCAFHDCRASACSWDIRVVWWSKWCHECLVRWWPGQWWSSQKGCISRVICSLGKKRVKRALSDRVFTRCNFMIFLWLLHRSNDVVAGKCLRDWCSWRSFFV